MELSTKELRFRKYEEFVRDGDAKLLVMHLTAHPEDAGALYHMLAERESEESSRFIQALRVVLNGGDGDDDFEIEDGRRRMLKSLFDRAAPGATSPYRRLSASRIRGTLTSGAADPTPETMEGEAVPSAPAASAGPAAGKPGPSRVVRGAEPRDPDAEESR